MGFYCAVCGFCRLNNGSSRYHFFRFFFSEQVENFFDFLIAFSQINTYLYYVVGALICPCFLFESILYAGKTVYGMCVINEFTHIVIPQSRLHSSFKVCIRVISYKSHIISIPFFRFNNRISIVFFQRCVKS